MSTDTAVTDRKAFKRWVNECPLRVWRLNEDVPILQTASALNKSMTIIQLWERGVHIPTPENMAGIARLTGVDVDKLTAAWLRWHDRKPSV